jgi:hypothetical protein
MTWVGQAAIFDGFSVGSNDLTQLVLGVDRDSALVARLFDERNPAVPAMIAHVIQPERYARRFASRRARRASWRILRWSRRRRRAGKSVRIPETPIRMR